MCTYICVQTFEMYVNSISQNARCLIVSGRLKSGLHYVQMSKQNEQKERKKIHTVRPASLKPRRSFSYTAITKKSCFDCAVALCTMQNALLVISNLTWLDLIYMYTEFATTCVVIFKFYSEKTALFFWLSSLKFCLLVHPYVFVLARSLRWEVSRNSDSPREHLRKRRR
jgi:hypothetical protein